MCTEFAEIDLSSFVYRLFHEDLSSIIGANTKNRKTGKRIWYLFLDICLANKHKSKGQLVVKLHCKWPVCGIAILLVLHIGCCCFVVIVIVVHGIFPPQSASQTKQLIIEQNAISCQYLITKVQCRKQNPW